MRMLFFVCLLLAGAAQADCPRNSDWYECRRAQARDNAHTLQDLADKTEAENNRRRALREQQHQTRELRRIRQEVERARRDHERAEW